MLKTSDVTVSKEVIVSNILKFLDSKLSAQNIQNFTSTKKKRENFYDGALIDKFKVGWVNAKGGSPM
jgi:hypothetical protein